MQENQMNAMSPANIIVRMILSLQNSLKVNYNDAKHYTLAIRGANSLNCGDKKLATNQNFTGFCVARLTLSIIMFRKRSYRCPLAIEKT